MDNERFEDIAQKFFIGFCQQIKRESEALRVTEMVIAELSEESKIKLFSLMLERNHYEKYKTYQRTDEMEAMIYFVMGDAKPLHEFDLKVNGIKKYLRLIKGGKAE